MFLKLRILALLTVCGALVSQPIVSRAGDSAEKRTALAKEAAERFATALQKKDLTTILEIAEVPFGGIDIQTDKNKLMFVTDKEELRKGFEQFLARVNFRTKKPVIKSVETYEAFQKRGSVLVAVAQGFQGGGKDAKLRNDDIVVEIEPLRNDSTYVFIFRIRDAKAKMRFLF